MRQLVRQAVREPAQRCRETALAILGSPVPSWEGQCRALQSWVQSNIRYVKDPPDVELVQTPQYTLQQRAGDCDDHAVLLASFLNSTGHPVEFMALGLNGQPLSHVLCRTVIRNRWVAAETIIPRALGWLPAGITEIRRQKV